MTQKHLCFSVVLSIHALAQSCECAKDGQLEMMITINEVICFSCELLLSQCDHWVTESWIYSQSL